MTATKKAAVASIATIDVSTCNPIIGSNAQETAYQSACAIAFLARFHSDLADWQSIADNSGECGPEKMLANEQRGLSVLCECIASALLFEAEGRS